VAVIGGGPSGAAAARSLASWGHDVRLAARDDEGVQWLPGCLPGVVPVQVDWECPRDEFRVADADGTMTLRASGFARPIPGVDPRRNLHGVSFAVAHITGFLARAISIGSTTSVDDALQRMRRFAELQRPDTGCEFGVASASSDF